MALAVVGAMGGQSAPVLRHPSEPATSTMTMRFPVAGSNHFKEVMVMADLYDITIAELKVTLRHYQEQLKHYENCKRELASARAAYSTLWSELQTLRPATEQLVQENAALRRAIFDHKWFVSIVPALMAGAGELQREAH